MKNKSLSVLIFLFLSIIFITSCTFKEKLISEEKVTPEEKTTSEGIPTQRDDFGCWPPSCSFMPAGMVRQMCEDWKAGKTVNWFDCSFFSQYPACQKLCEFEIKSGNPIETMPSLPSTSPTGQNYPQPPIGYGQEGQNYEQNDQQPQANTGIPPEDPGTENVYIYFTDFKHGRIIRIDDMTGKNWVSYGSLGTGIGQFTTPEKFLVQSDGHIYLADPNGNRIVRIDDMTGKGWVSYGSHGIDGGHSRGIGQFNQPHAVRLDAQGRIYIADGGNCRIVRIDDMTGAGWTEYGTGKQCGQSATTIGNTFDIAFDAQGRIYTIDGTDTPRIIRIDDMTGNGFITYGTKGTGVGQFTEPQSITFDAQGRIYVADEDKTTQGDRIIRIDDMTGAGWISFPLTGSSDPKIMLPHDIRISDSGRIYIANTRNNGIVRMDDMTGKGYISYAPYQNTEPRNTYTNQLEAPKGIFVVEK